MKTESPDRKLGSISKSRWLAYATASAATAMAGGGSVQAAIHYSGPLNVEYPPRGTAQHSFVLDQAGDSFQFTRTSNGFVDFHIIALEREGMRVPRGNIDHFYVSRLGSGQKVSFGYFTQPPGSHVGTLIFSADSPPFRQWRRRGIGFVGFQFDSGAGRQYGWARLDMAGPKKKNAFTLVDFAYADPGEAIKTGQTTSDSEAPVLGSLGLLAAGAVGLVAWRKSRAGNAE